MSIEPHIWLAKFRGVINDTEVLDTPKDTKKGKPKQEGIGVFLFTPTFTGKERLGLARFFYNKDGVKEWAGRTIRKKGEPFRVYDLISTDPDRAIELAETIMKVCGGKEKVTAKVEMEDKLRELGI